MRYDAPMNASGAREPGSRLRSILAACVWLALAPAARADAPEAARSATVIRLEVEQSYVFRERSSIKPLPIEGFVLPLADAAEDLMLGAGIAIAEEGDVTLRIVGNGEALGGLLFGELQGYLYTGAQVRGTIEVLAGGDVVYSTPYAGREERRRSLERNLGYEDPANAPFPEALEAAGSFYERLVAAVGAVWGAPPLIAALEESGAPLRPYAARVLGDLGDGSAVPALIAVLGDQDRAVRWQAAWSLGRLGDPAAIEPLLGALDDRDADVRWFASWSLAELTGERFGGDTEAWLAWWQGRAGE
jgi:hypothetical protein